jgi:hypothetical protein
MILRIQTTKTAHSMPGHSVDSDNVNERLCFLCATSRAACEMTLALQLGNTTPATPATGNICHSHLFDFVKAFVLFDGRNRI